MAGTTRGRECTLIVTEGDSAKALAVAGLSVVGRDHYGVFPLKGKLLNTRGMSAAAMMANTELSALTRILGLDPTCEYHDEAQLQRLRYGRVLVMADADVDGTHIKGLLLNWLHSQWPHLLRRSGFTVCEFVTPLVKARKGSLERAFYSTAELRRWQESEEGAQR